MLVLVSYCNNSRIFHLIILWFFFLLGSTRHSLIDSELFSPTEYVSMFSSGFREQIVELLLKIAKSLNDITPKVDKKPENIVNNSYLDLFVNFFTNNDLIVSNKSNVDVEKIKNHLNLSIQFISNLFDIPQQSIETILINAQKDRSLIDNETIKEDGIYINLIY